MHLAKNLLHLLTGFRKLLFGLIFMGVTLTLLIIGKVSGSEFITTNRDVVVAFIAANIGAKIIEVTRTWLTKKK
jgi:hypothetical protein